MNTETVIVAHIGTYGCRGQPFGVSDVGGSTAVSFVSYDWLGSCFVWVRVK